MGDASAHAPAQGQVDNTDPMAVSADPDPFHWSQLESSDFKAYIANLRGVGCPEPTVRDIIRAEVDRLFAARHEALESPPPNHQNFWERRREWGPRFHYERRLKHRELEREREALMAELLGPLGDGESPVGQGEASQNPPGGDPGQITPEVADQVHEIQEKYMHLREEIFHQAEGRIYPDDLAVLQELHDQRLTELSQVLSPEQLREFELREGPVAERLRHELDPFKPTEEEFRAIHEVRQTFAGEYGYEEFDFADPAYHRAREQAEQQMNQQLESILGEERFADYQLSRNPHYRDLHALGERFELPSESVNEMFDLWQISEQQVDQVHGNPELDPEQRHQVLRAMRQELESEAQQILGEAAFHNYRSRGGEWIHHMFGEEDWEGP
jgi:hypothetical protein